MPSARDMWAAIIWPMIAPNKSLDASGGSVFLNLLGAADGALIRAAASTQPFDSFFRKVEMKTPFTLTVSVFLVAQCGGVHNRSTQQSPPQAKQASTDTQKKQCDFSDFKPLRLRATT